MKTLDSTKSGACGEIVASRNRFGPHERRRVRHLGARTPAQRRDAQDFGLISSGWDQLTQDERRLWIAGSPQAFTRRRNGKRYPLTGQLFYQKLNKARAKIGLPLLRVPSPKPPFQPNPIGPLTITNIGGFITLFLDVPELPAGHTMVFGSPPYKAGRSYCGNFTYLGLLPAPKRGRSNITKLYLKTHSWRYGPLQPGSRIFIYTKQQIDGWENEPVKTSAVVPPPQTTGRPFKTPMK